MGARPLRRAIQRYIEDPLADEVLRAGPDSIASGTNVLVDKDADGDEDHPLSLKLIKPRKRPAKKKEDGKEPVAVGAKGDGEQPEAGEPAGDEPSADEA
jgi:ATP-dependent Clp protease ATP-binding subunit ClpC